MTAAVSGNRTQNTGASYLLFPHESRMLKKYVEYLARCEKPEVLDVGPVCGNNISFFLERVKRLHVCDLVSRLSPEKKHEPEAEGCLSLLDYREKSLDGIHLWDFPDHIGNRALSLFVRKLHGLLKPTGRLIMIASTASAVQPFPLFFVIRNDCAVVLENKPERRISYFYRSNRDIEQSMKPFRQAHSFICSSGVREFLFRPGP
jgi:hypothetical protein